MPSFARPVNRMNKLSDRNLVATFVGSGVGLGLALGSYLGYESAADNKDNLKAERDKAAACLTHVETFGTRYTTSGYGSILLNNCGIQLGGSEAQEDTHLVSLTVDLPSATQLEKRIEDAQSELTEQGSLDLGYVGLFTMMGFGLGYASGIQTISKRNDA